MSKERAASAGAWSALDIILRQGVGFGVTVILARLLSIEDFGAIAILAFFSTLSIVFVQGGLSLALVQRQETTHAEENAVFWVNLIAGILFALVMIAIAPGVARYYDNPVLDPLMYVAAAQVVLSALGAVHLALLSRALRFDLITRVGIASSLLSGAAGVWAAFAGMGVWALGIQLVVMAGVNSAGSWWVNDWRPSWTVRFAAARPLIGFGINISLSSTLEVLFTNGFSLVIGKLYGLRDLGILNRASNVNALPTGIVAQVIARTALPLFSARLDDPEALKRGFRLAISLAMMLSLPLMVGLAVLSDLIVVTLFGPKWRDVAPILSILAMGGLLLPLHILNLQLLLAQGQSRAFLHLEIQKKLVGIACLGVGCIWGITGVAYATVVFGVIALLINAWPTRRSIGYGVVAQLADLRGVFAAAGFMAGVVFLLQRSLVLQPIPSLIILVAAGGAAYATFGFIFRVRAFREALELATSLLRRRWPRQALIAR